MKDEQVPSWFSDFEDARLLGVKPWELDSVPYWWRLRARTANAARHEARLAIAKRMGAMGVFVIDV